MTIIIQPRRHTENTEKITITFKRAKLSILSLTGVEMNPGFKGYTRTGMYEVKTDWSDQGATRDRQQTLSVISVLRALKQLKFLLALEIILQ